MKCSYVKSQFFIYDQHSAQREAIHLDTQTHNLIKHSSCQKNHHQQRINKKLKHFIKSEYQLEKKLQQYDKTRIVSRSNDQNP